MSKWVVLCPECGEEFKIDIERTRSVALIAGMKGTSMSWMWKTKWP